MTKVKIAICDDEKNYRDEILEYITGYFNDKSEFVVLEFFSGEDLIQYYNKGEVFDLIFLDIEMKDKNGIETAKEIREADENVIIIFITSHISYVYDTFRVNAFQFLKKPIDKQDFDKDFNRAILAYKKKHHKYEIKYKNKVSVLEIKDITHIEVFDHSICVYCNSKCFKKTGKLKDEISYLKSYNFVQCHKSIIVNMNYIKSIEETTIILKNNENLILSKKYKKAFTEVFNKFLFESCI